MTTMKWQQKYVLQQQDNTHLIHVLIKHVCIHFVSNIITCIHCLIYNYNVARFSFYSMQEKFRWWLKFNPQILSDFIFFFYSRDFYFIFRSMFRSLFSSFILKKNTPNNSQLSRVDNQFHGRIIYSFLVIFLHFFFWMLFRFFFIYFIFILQVHHV